MREHETTSYDGYERLHYPFPMAVKLQRELPQDYHGPVFVWDLDKTYLNTRFSQLKHLLRIPFELGVDKSAVPGTPELLHGLRDGPDDQGQSPIYFVSASPRQLANAVEAKMLLDGIQYDGMIFKDVSKLLVQGRIKELKHQVAFKLCALFTLFESLPSKTELHLVGDDVEADALIYALFADMVSGRLYGENLVHALSRTGVQPHFVEIIEELAESCEKRASVVGIYIRLVRCPDGSSLSDFHSGILGWPTSTAFAGLLRNRNFISKASFEQVSRASPPSEIIPGNQPENRDDHWTPSRFRA